MFENVMKWHETKLGKDSSKRTHVWFNYCFELQHKYKELTDAAFKVASYLEYFAHEGLEYEDMYIDTTNEEIALHVGLSVRTVTNIINTLVNVGYITRKYKGFCYDDNSSRSKYKLNTVDEQKRIEQTNLKSGKISMVVKSGLVQGQPCTVQSQPCTVQSQPCTV